MARPSHHTGIPVREAPDWSRLTSGDNNPYHFPTHDGWTDFCEARFSLTVSDYRLREGEVTYLIGCTLPKHHAGPHKTNMPNKRRVHGHRWRPQTIFWTTPDQVVQYDADGYPEIDGIPYRWYP